MRSAAAPPPLRAATRADVPAVDRLIAASVRELARGDYTDAQIDAALGTAWGVDTQLIDDGTLLVADVAGEVVACGGWSFRATLFGGDTQPDRSAATLDPQHDAARIRACFVHPAWARRGLGRAILAASEAEARAHGFRVAELVATLPGERLYRACGYVGLGAREYTLPSGIGIVFVPMRKALG